MEHLAQKRMGISIVWLFLECQTARLLGLSVIRFAQLMSRRLQERGDMLGIDFDRLRKNSQCLVISLTLREQRGKIAVCLYILRSECNGPAVRVLGFCELAPRT